jgi:hypothetical protein
MPSRDVFLSPDHTVFVDGVLILVKHLINGCGIVQVPMNEVSYFHFISCEQSYVLAVIPAKTGMTTSAAIPRYLSDQFASSRYTKSH